MNVDRAAHRVGEVGLRRTEAPRRAFDLTVSDQGVEPRGIETKAPAEIKAPAEMPTVASTPQMQNVLSAAETRALHEAFFTPKTAEPGAEARPLAGGYNLRGQLTQADSQVSSGGVLDITG